MSNSQRVTNQLIAIPAACALGAIVAWPISWQAAKATAWLTTGTFADFWLGAVAVASFLIAAGLTLGFICSALDATQKWFAE